MIVKYNFYYVHFSFARVFEMCNPLNLFSKFISNTFMVLIERYLRCSLLLFKFVIGRYIIFILPKYKQVSGLNTSIEKLFIHIYM